jgi:hypothetical protein
MLNDDEPSSSSLNGTYTRGLHEDGQGRHRQQNENTNLASLYDESSSDDNSSSETLSETDPATLLVERSQLQAEAHTCLPSTFAIEIVLHLLYYI